MPWFDIPEDRKTLFIEPLYPRGGLLGGSPDAAPKMSKLQALAAARKKKAQEQKSGSTISAVEEPLKELNISEPSEKPKTISYPLSTNTSGTEAKENRRPYTGLKRKNSSPHRKPVQPEGPIQTEVQHACTEEKALKSAAEILAPSAFASTMFSNSPTASRLPQTPNFSLSYTSAPPGDLTDAFAGPSPDDIVIAAQSKGSTQSSLSRK